MLIHVHTLNSNGSNGYTYHVLLREAWFCMAYQGNVWTRVSILILSPILSPLNILP